MVGLGDFGMSLTLMHAAAHDASNFVWESLEEIRARGIPVREDAMTSFMLNVLCSHMSRSPQKTFGAVDRSKNESKTGMDLEVWVSTSPNRGTGWIFQAKQPRLNNGGDPSLDHIQHKVKSSGKHQYELLETHAKTHGLRPYYLFYLGWTQASANVPWIPVGTRTQAEYGCSAVRLADVQSVCVNGRPRPKLIEFQGKLVPWEDLFLPPSTPTGPTPPGGNGPSGNGLGGSPSGIPNGNGQDSPGAAGTTDSASISSQTGPLQVPLPWYVRALQELNVAYSTKQKRGEAREQRIRGQSDLGLVMLLDWIFTSDSDTSASGEPDEALDDELEQGKRWLIRETNALSSVETRQLILERLVQETGVPVEITNPETGEVDLLKKGKLRDYLNELAQTFPRMILVLAHDETESQPAK